VLRSFLRSRVFGESEGKGARRAMAIVARPKLPIIQLTKIDVAEEHMKAAVRLYFSGAHAVPVDTLAAAAREVLTTLGDIMNIDTVLHDFSKRRNIPLKQAISAAHEFAKFMKHANKTPTRNWISIKISLHRSC
jgi:hypothetical protein